MGSEQSTLRKKGYRQENETRYPIVATKGDEKFFIKKINLHQVRPLAIKILKICLKFN